MPAYAAGFLQAAARFGPDESKTISPQALGPVSGQSAVLGRDALDVPGDCIRARRGEIAAKRGRKSI